eukprot:3478120-Pyramimonas_sp.AAC.1
MWFSRGHLGVSHISADDAAVRGLHAEGSAAVGGFAAMTVHQHGFPVIAILFYRFSSDGFGGRNLQRYARL